MPVPILCGVVNPLELLAHSEVIPLWFVVFPIKPELGIIDVVSWAEEGLLFQDSIHFGLGGGLGFGMVSISWRCFNSFSRVLVQSEVSFAIISVIFDAHLS